LDLGLWRKQWCRRFTVSKLKAYFTHTYNFRIHTMKLILFRFIKNFYIRGGTLSK
jgi:hypothetical protein